MMKQTTIEHLVKFNEIVGKLNTTSSQDLLIDSTTQAKEIKKQTAVEWLLEELNDNGFSHLDLATDIIKQAKQMEKEQHEMTFNEALDENSNRWFEKYYNETFKNS